jgi:hypothetical protein
MKKDSIVYLVTSDKKSGGNVYERYLQDLNLEYEVLIDKRIKNKIKKLFYFFYSLYKVNKKEYGTIIRKSESVFFMNKAQNNIVIFHHYYPAPSNILVNLFQRLAHKNLLRNLDKIDTLVVVSQYWKEYFENIGFTHTKIIYNPFNIEEYLNFDSKKVEQFKLKYKLDKKPILYLGNPQKSKGTDKSYAALKDLDVHLITSGHGELKLPIQNLNLSFEEYILLLHASSLSILMTQIDEGWNRVAHESILCKTPVIGTGRAGMGELLEKSGQIFCRDFENLKELVKKSIDSNLEVSGEALEYVKRFSLLKFYTEWKNIL